MNWEAPVTKSEKKIPLETGFNYLHCSREEFHSGKSVCLYAVVS